MDLNAPPARLEDTQTPMESFWEAEEKGVTGGKGCWNWEEELFGVVVVVASGGGGIGGVRRWWWWQRQRW